jgi:hypothetical protein
MTNPNTTLISRSTRHATLLIDTFLSENSLRDRSTDLICLQIKIFLAVEADNRFLDSPESQGGLVYSTLLGNALALAYSMKVNALPRISAPTTGNETVTELDEDRLARQLWWTLIIMSRWLAMSKATPVLIPEQSFVVYPSYDKTLLGPKTYHLARKSGTTIWKIRCSNIISRPHCCPWRCFSCKSSSSQPSHLWLGPYSTTLYTS